MTRKAGLIGSTLLILAAVLPAGMARGQDLLFRSDRTVNLHLQLDRTRIRAFEPIFLFITADRFADDLGISVQISRQDKPLADLGDLKGMWVSSEKRIGGELLQQKMATLLVNYNDPEKGVKFLFGEPGEYKIRVAIGSDITILRLNVSEPDEDDAAAYQVIGPKAFPFLFIDEFNAPPANKLWDLCKQVSDDFPQSRCADYARGYMAIADFKRAFAENQRKGGRNVYGSVADGLERALRSFKDCFYEEHLGFYTAYAEGLCGDWTQVVKTIENIHTCVTPWGESMGRMKKEVLEHTKVAP